MLGKEGVVKSLTDEGCTVIVAQDALRLQLRVAQRREHLARFPDHQR